MKATVVILGMILFGGSGLVIFSGCGGPPLHQANSTEAWSAAQRPANLGETQITPLLAQVSRLQGAAQEALDAARHVRTPDRELIAAQQDFASAEQLLQDGKAAYVARQYEHSWDSLRAADAAFRQAEETAVRAGLGQLERELTAAYGRRLNRDALKSPSSAAGRVSQGNANLRAGAGTHFQVIGKAQLGDPLDILAESGEWYHVRTGTGVVGWVSKTLVTNIPNP